MGLKDVLKVAILIYAANCVAEVQLTKHNFDWYLKNQKWVECQLVSGLEPNVTPVINTLGLIWKYRDGAIGAEVAPMITKAFIYQPETMLIWFSKHPKLFDSFLQRLPFDVFTDFSGTKEGAKNLETLRINLINSMQNIENSSGVFEEAQRLLKKAKSIDVDIIN